MEAFYSRYLRTVSLYSIKWNAKKDDAVTVPTDRLTDDMNSVIQVNNALASGWTLPAAVSEDVAGTPHKATSWKPVWAA